MAATDLALMSQFGQPQTDAVGGHYRVINTGGGQREGINTTHTRDQAHLDTLVEWDNLNAAGDAAGIEAFKAAHPDMFTSTWDDLKAAGKDLATNFVLPALGVYAGMSALGSMAGGAGALGAGAGESVSGLASSHLGAGVGESVSGLASSHLGAGEALASWGPGEAVSGLASSHLGSGAAAATTGGVGNWITNAWNSLMGTGASGAAAGGAAAAGGGGLLGALGGNGGWLGPLMSVGSGIYGLSQAKDQKKLAQQAIQGAGSPWFTPSAALTPGAATAGQQLTSVIKGDFSKDAGYDLAQQAAARTASQQPGGFAASAAAMAALKYQNDRIAALSGPAGVGIAPGGGYQLALSGSSDANKLASSSLGSIAYGMTGNQAGIPPWLTSYLIANGIKV